MMVPLVLNSMVAGILFYTAYQFLFIGLRNRKSPEYLIFGSIVLLQGICALIEFFGVTTEVQNTYLAYRQVYYNLTGIINFSFFLFISIISGVKLKIWYVLYGFSVTAALVFNNLWDNIAVINHAAVHHYPHLNDSHFFRPWAVRINFMFVITNCLQFIALVIFSYAAYQYQLRSQRVRSYFIIACTFLFILGGLNSIMVDVDIVHYPISSYFYLVLIIYISNRLYKNLEQANRFRNEVTQGEQRLRQIIDMVPNLIFAKDPDGRYLIANKALADIYGTTTDMLIGKSHGDFVNDPGTNEIFLRQDQEVIRAEKPMVIPEEYFTDAEGKVKILETVKIPFTYMDSKAVLGVSTDITALKNSEIVLKNNEKLLETIFDNASVAMVLLDQKTDVLKINKAGTELGLSSEKGTGMPSGNTLNCITSFKNEKGCGYSPECSVCNLRTSIHSTFSKKAGVNKVPFKIAVKRNSEVISYSLLISTSYFELNNSSMVLMVLEDVTTLAKAEQALIDSEFRYKQITRAITDYIYTIIVHENGDIQTIHTPACFFITGYRAEEFDADPGLWFSIIFNEDREKVVETIINISQTQDKNYIEHRIIRKDGVICWVSNKLVMKRIRKNGVLQYDGILQDITVRKHAEQALENQNKLLNTMLDNLPIGIFMVKASDGTPLVINEHAKRLLGRGILPNTSINNMSFIYKAYKTGSNQSYPIEETPLFKGTQGENARIDNLEVELPDGSRTLLEIVGCPVYDANNRIWASLVGFYDITERKQAEQELRRSEEKFRNIFNTSNDAIMVTDLDSRILEVNQISLERTGLTLSQFKNLLLIDLLDPCDRNEVTNQFKKLSQNKSVTFHSSYVNINGERVYVEINGHLITYGEKPAALLVSRDITERILLQQKILNAIIEAEEKERSFFSQELHDGIGPILSTIKLYLEWIQNPEAKSDKAALLKDALNTVEDAIVSVKEISNRLSPNILTKFGLETAIQSFIRKTSKIGKVNFTLHIDLPLRLRAETETMLYRVLVEAINNSLKYACASNIIIDIKLEIDGIRAVFKDDGVGFNVEEVLSKKTGNGLFNMQNRVETYQGNFTLNSKPGKGTEIIVFIPINKYDLIN